MMKTPDFRLSRCQGAALWAILLSAFATSLYGEAKAGDPVESSLDALTEQIEETLPGKIHLNIRTRFEHFDLDGAPERNGISQRLYYGYTTPVWEGLSASVEGETLYPWGSRSDLHPLDDAAVGTRLNQLWGQYQHDLGSLKAGRQVFVLDDQRFIGHVGWRQSNQTFDAVTGTLTPIDEVTLRPFYLDRVNRVNGQREDLTGWGINARIDAIEALSASLFYYSLDFDDMANFSNDTLGVRLEGSYPLESLTLGYQASYAYQTENSGNPAGVDFGLSYWAGELTGTWQGLTFGGGMESLEGDGQEGFRTPLGTVHAFNGFADVFLPVAGLSQGLNDYYIFARYALPVGNSIPLTIRYHWFETQQNNQRLGEEIDLVASYAFNAYFGMLAKYGYFSSRGEESVPYGGADKTMFTVELNFQY